MSMQQFKNKCETICLGACGRLCAVNGKSALVVRWRSSCDAAAPAAMQAAAPSGHRCGVGNGTARNRCRAGYRMPATAVNGKKSAPTVRQKRFLKVETTRGTRMRPSRNLLRGACGNLRCSPHRAPQSQCCAHPNGNLRCSPHVNAMSAVFPQSFTRSTLRHPR
mgnify:CR=1 FL=1